MGKFFKILFGLAIVAAASAATVIYFSPEKNENYVDIEVDFDFSQALPYAHMSNFVYSSEQEINDNKKLRKQIKQVTQSKIFANRTLEQEAARYLIFRDKEKQTIAVRGTVNANDWIKNIQYVKVFDEKLGIHLHKGFRDIALLIYEDIEKNQLLDKKRSLHLTGHSMGGAIAAILMMYYEKDGFRMEKTFTFGQPRVTNEEGVKKGIEIFGNDADARYVRVLNHDSVSDIVDRVPPNTTLGVLNGPYQQFGPEIVMLGDRKHYVFGWDKELDTKQKSGLQEEIRKLLEPFVLAHSLDSYISSMEEKIKNGSVRVLDKDRNSKVFAKK